MGLGSRTPSIPRVWEVDWAIPASEGGTPWDSYAWLLDTAEREGLAEVTILGHTYQNLGNLDLAIGGTEANYLRTGGHAYEVDGITVHGVSCRGSWRLRGPVLVAWANDRVLTEVEGQKPPAVAAVASWPDYIAGWLSVYRPERIGQVRPEQEAEFATTVVSALDPRAAAAVRGAAAGINESHAVLATQERERMVGMFIALRRADIQIDGAALQAHLMAGGWNGKLVGQVLELGDRVARGETPRHQYFELPASA